MTNHDTALTTASTVTASSPVNFWRTAVLVLSVQAVTLLALWALQSYFTI